MSRKTKRPHQPTVARTEPSARKGSRARATAVASKRGASRKNRAFGGSDALTVGWMLATLTTLVLEIAILAIVIIRSRTTGGTKGLDLLGGLLLFAAAVIGFVVLVMTPITLKARRDPPPRRITLGAIAIGALPMLIILWRQVG